MKPPYFAVIFTNVQSETLEGYDAVAAEMERLAKQQPGFLGMDSVRNGLGITVSYWQTEGHIAQWKAQVDHQMAQKLGREKWYANYSVRICLVTREYGFQR